MIRERNKNGTQSWISKISVKFWSRQLPVASSIWNVIWVPINQTEVPNKNKRKNDRTMLLWNVFKYLYDENRQNGIGMKYIFEWDAASRTRAQNLNS